MDTTYFAPFSPFCWVHLFLNGGKLKRKRGTMGGPEKSE